MMAVVAAILFGLALIFRLADFSLEIFTASLLTTAGLLFAALHLAGVGSAVRRGGGGGGRSWRGRRPWRGRRYSRR
ncbi:hypothetical protein AB0I28_08735 [Phytomonospora sp. NPDC050363]|uniref:hypothetical protein n=1 Tax=Phytomonospora sp. NPDC050363 TaxID=3155642 RepID=UPI0033DACE67